jgi:hypothetical protein
MSDKVPPDEDDDNAAAAPAKLANLGVGQVARDRAFARRASALVRELRAMDDDSAMGIAGRMNAQLQLDVFPDEPPRNYWTRLARMGAVLASPCVGEDELALAAEMFCNPEGHPARTSALEMRTLELASEVVYRIVGALVEGADRWGDERVINKLEDVNDLLLDLDFLGKRRALALDRFEAGIDSLFERHGHSEAWRPDWMAGMGYVLSQIDRRFEALEEPWPGVERLVPSSRAGGNPKHDGPARMLARLAIAVGALGARPDEDERKFTTVLLNARRTFTKELNGGS